MSDEWKQRRVRAEHALVDARDAIDELSDVTHDSEVDMKLCFAGNIIEGAFALIREATRLQRKARK